MKYIVRYFTSFCQFSSLKSVKYFGICFTKPNLSEQKIEVGLHIEQEINQIQRYLEKEPIIFCKLTCGWLNTRFDSASETCSISAQGDSGIKVYILKNWSWETMLMAMQYEDRDWGQGPYDKYIQMVWLSFTYTN